MKLNLRLVLYALTFFIAFILWEKWQFVTQQQVEQQSTVIANIPNIAPAAPNSNTNGKMSLPGAAPSNSSASLPNNTAVTTNTDNIEVQTDLMRLMINLHGGTISRVALLKYPVSKYSKQPLALMHEGNPSQFILQTGLETQESSNQQQVPNETALFSTTKKVFTLADGQDTLVVPLQWKNQQGITVRKIFTFKRNKYVFNIKQEVDNQSTLPWQGYAYEQLLFGTAASSGGIGHIATFTGGVVSTKDDRYNKIKLNDFDQNIQLVTDSGWIAMIQHYFLGALIPAQNQNSTFYTREYDNNHILGVTGENLVIQPGQKGSFDIQAYVGPKIQSRLQKIAPALDKTVDYSWLFMIAQPMFYVLSFIHSIIGNWGWSIIIMTLLIKLLFFTPSAWAYKSMAKMRRLQPQMKRLKERYGEDRQGMSQAMMQLYREEKVNPASGCLPMLLQIPFFIAFYWVLVESVELRQAPWILWVQDLSARDPYFILPIVNAALMFVQQKLNPPPPDPMQAKIMSMLPLIFGFMFMWFPSGLVLYWTVSNAFSIVQQSIMNKRYGEPKNKTHKES